MRKGQIRRYHLCFGRYTRQFLQNCSKKDRTALGLKVMHSQRVRKLMKELSIECSFSQHISFLAELCGLFHDIGRFEQFRRYHTFFDLESEDHADLGVSVLEREGMLDDLEPIDKQVVLDAIGVHNKFSIPADFEGDRLVLSMLLRDADKIDIWRVFDDCHRKGVGAEVINLGLPAGNDISDDVFDAFVSGKVVNIGSVRSQIDFMVMRLSWLYDMNFIQSLGKIVKRGYVKDIVERLPVGEKRDLILDKISVFLKDRGL